MCDPASITMATIGVGSSLIDAKNQNKAYAAGELARRKQLMQMVRQANTQDANLQLQDKSNFEAAIQELEKTTMDSVKAQGTVQTAMTESNLEGRSMERTKRDVENVYLRNKGMINENYERDYANIYAQRVSNRDNLIAAIEGMPPLQRPDSLSQGLNVVTAGVQGAIVGSNIWGTYKKTPQFGNTGVTK